MGIGERIADAIKRYQEQKRMTAKGSYGEFYREGGEELLYDLPVKTGELVIDAGGYGGKWTAAMLARYGCRSEIFEPIPAFAKQINKLFKNNDFVSVHKAALGGSERTTQFSLEDDGSSEYRAGQSDVIHAKVMDIADVLTIHDGEDICTTSLLSVYPIRG